MSNFTLIVKLKMKPGTREEFIPLILENQRASLANEPGCRRFDVYLDNEHEDSYGFVEEYDDEDAFKAHQASEHFAIYYEAVKDWFVERDWMRAAKLEGTE